MLDFPSGPEVRRIVDALSSLELFWSENANWSGPGVLGAMQRLPGAPYTVEEEAWLKRQFVEFDTTYHQVRERLGNQICTLGAAVIYSSLKFSKSFFQKKFFFALSALE